MRFAAAWTGQGFIDWNGINFNGSHQVHPRDCRQGGARQPQRARAGPTPETAASSTSASGAATAATMVPCRVGWVHYKGLYQHADRMILSYTVGQAEILETPGLEHDPALKDRPIFTRTLNIGRSPHELRLRVPPRERPWPWLPERGRATFVYCPAMARSCSWFRPRSRPLKIKLLMAERRTGQARGIRPQLAAAGELWRNSPAAAPRAGPSDCRPGP